jgi:hypothetical protein
VQPPLTELLSNDGDLFRNQTGIAIALDKEVALGIEKKIGAEAVFRAQNIQGCGNGRYFENAGRNQG